MAVTNKDIFRILKEIAENTAKKSLVHVSSRGGSGATVSILQDMLVELTAILTETTAIEGNTDGLESLLTSLNGLVSTETTLASVLTALGPLALEATSLLISSSLSSLDTKATTRDGILQDIDDNTDGIEGRQDTGNTSLASILTNAIAILADTALMVPDVDDMRTRIADIESDVTAIEADTDFLQTTFELIPPGAMATLIAAIEATILVITAQLEAGGLNVADLLTTIDADTGSIRDRVLQTNRKADRRDGNTVWEYSGTFTCNIVGSLTLTWICTAGTWSALQITTGGFPLPAATYQLVVIDSTTGRSMTKVGDIALQALIVNTTKDASPASMVGPLNSLIFNPILGAPLFAVGNILNISLRVAVHDDSGAAPPLPAIPTVGGSGTFAVVTNINRVNAL